MTNSTSIQQDNLTRTDAIRLWQDAKRAVETSNGQRDAALKDVTRLGERVKELEKRLAEENKLRKDAEAKINSAQGQTRLVEKQVEELERKLQVHRDRERENAKLEQRNRSLKADNDLLKQKVEQLRNHDFKADNAALRARLEAEVAGRAEDALMAEEKDAGRRVTIGEQADAINGLRRELKEALEKNAKYVREEVQAAADIEKAAS